MASSSLSGPSNVGVLVLLKYGNDSFSIRLYFDSTVDTIIDAACGKWIELSPLSLRLYHIRDGLRRNIENNSDLHSILLLASYYREDYLVFYIDVNRINSSASPDSNSSLVSDSSFGSSSESNNQFKQLLKTDLNQSVFSGVGQQFKGGVTEFRLYLMMYSMKTGYKLNLLKNDKERVTPVCSKKNCSFRIHASIKFNLPGFFVVKRLQAEHNCGAGIHDINNPVISSKLIKLLVCDHIHANPLMKTKDIMNLFQTEYNVILKYYYAYTGKKLALDDLHGSDVMSYHHLQSFCDAVLSTNPGSTVVLECNDSTRQFERVFIGFEACSFGFQFCRPLIFVDATFMKGRAQGCLMAATGKNGNEGFFPIAIAIVSGEDEANWIWFCEQLREFLKEDSRSYVFISDRHPGILAAIPQVFPNSIHGSCFYHLTNNLKVALKSQFSKTNKRMLLDSFSRIAYAYNLTDFNAAVKNFRDVGGSTATNFLSGIPFEKFSNVFFPGCRYGEMSSNCSESFNKWILEERHLPITACLDKIRMKLMKLMSDRREVASTWNSVLCPAIETRLRSLHLEGSSWFVIKSSEYNFEVHSPVHQLVDLYNRVCTCNVWQISGFPCAHAVRSILSCESLSVYDYIESYFKVGHFQLSYSHPINPVVNYMGEDVALEDAIIRPPKGRRMPGRPSSSKRLKSAGEFTKTTRCGLCNKLGHNKRTCSSIAK